MKIGWLDTGASGAAQNMAMDEALFLKEESVIRFYEWRERSFSIGYFQKMTHAPSAYPVVRRITGGGVVEHGEDLTFSLVLDRDFSPFLRTLPKSYFWIHEGLRKAFGKRGFPMEIFSRASNPEFSNGANGEELCFRSPSPGDLVFEGLKWMGGAQRRRGRFLLHQGSLQWRRLGLPRDTVKKIMLDGFDDLFQAEIQEKTDMFSDVNGGLESLREKYISKEWTYRY